ncbi:transporter substrate-binding domain-containing protein [Georgenia sp. EYE_87]|uniref:transporter substrate-binding domain-containing protein n=1 Tax=Georgenia sp. EYE_87 TaxID=2853448 RepID=UPI002004F0B1|nr:transporter substrate-binding domain-containing protein [Georgenia sp. EYE_87]MCK6211929.1 transporter substrate-binding domain-containing protein [Georgenia sp. EYE_87]
MSARSIRTAALAAGAALLLAACGGGGDGGETPAGDTGAGGDAAAEFDLVEPGTLTACSEVPYPPFEVEDSGAPSGYSGFDIDLLQAIADNLGLELAVADVSFDALQSGTTLVAGQCDVGASAITITEERKANLDFTDPYYDSLQSLLVPADSDIEGIEDLAGKSVAVQQGTTGQAYAEENAPEAKLSAFPGDGEMWPALQAGQVDAILQDLPVNVEHAKADENYVIVEEFETGEQYGFALAKGEKPELLEAINTELQNLRDDGTYQEIYDSYFAADGS